MCIADNNIVAFNAYNLNINIIYAYLQAYKISIATYSMEIVYFKNLDT